MSALAKIMERGLPNEEKMRLLDFLKGAARNFATPPSVRAGAMLALARTGQPEALSVLLELLVNSTNPYRDTASWAIKVFVDSNQVSAERRAEIFEHYKIALLNDEDPYSRANVVYSMSAVFGSDCLPLLHELLGKESDPLVIEDIAEAMAKIGGEAEFQNVVSLLAHADPMVRMAAAIAVSRLGDKVAALRLPARQHLEALDSDKEHVAVRAMVAGPMTD
jgi:HEAT repeat protein